MEEEEEDEKETEEEVEKNRFLMSTHFFEFAQSKAWNVMKMEI